MYVLVLEEMDEETSLFLRLKMKLVSFDAEWDIQYISTPFFIENKFKLYKPVVISDKGIVVHK